MPQKLNFRYFKKKKKTCHDPQLGINQNEKTSISHTNSISCKILFCKSQSKMSKFSLPIKLQDSLISSILPTNEWIIAMFCMQIDIEERKVQPFQMDVVMPAQPCGDMSKILKGTLIYLMDSVVLKIAQNLSVGHIQQVRRVLDTLFLCYSQSI